MEPYGVQKSRSTRSLSWHLLCATAPGGYTVWHLRASAYSIHTAPYSRPDHRSVTNTWSHLRVATLTDRFPMPNDTTTFSHHPSRSRLEMKTVGFGAMRTLTDFIGVGASGWCVRRLVGPSYFTARRRVVNLHISSSFLKATSKPSTFLFTFLLMINVDWYYKTTA